MTTPSLPSWVALADGGPVARLTGIVGMRTIHATADPAEFAHMLRSARPRIAIVGTPPAGADDLAAALQERRRRPALRVVVVSPSDAINERLDALRAGADEAHADTIDPAELGARLTHARGADQSSATTRSWSSPATPSSTSSPTRCDGSGALVHLRPKEFQLLAMLATHPGRAYTRRLVVRSHLGARTTKVTRAPSTFTSAGCAASSNRKPDAPVHLVTVRGVGYRLDPGPR